MSDVMHFVQHNTIEVIARQMQRDVDEIVKLREELALLERNAQDEINRLECQKIALEQRAEAAEAKLKAASEQEPIRWELISPVMGVDITARKVVADNANANGCKVTPLYAKPVPPVDAQELQKKYDRLDAIESTSADLNNRQAERIAELEHKLAFWQNSSKEWKLAYVAKGGTASDSGTEELNTLLAQAEEEGRKAAIPEGWQVVPKEPTKEMLCAYLDCDATAIAEYKAMLAASPKPDVKP